MTLEVKVPMLPESVADATVAKWYKQPGDAVRRDENLVDLETDKVMLEVPAPADGVLERIVKQEGETVTPDELLAMLKEGQVSAAAPSSAAASASDSITTASSNATAVKAPTVSAQPPSELSPAVRRMLAEHNLDVSRIKGSGKGGRITKTDVEQYLRGESKPQSGSQQPPAASGSSAPGSREEQRVAMSRLRARIAERLLEVKQETAMLTTFNEVNMKPVMDLRTKYRDHFEKAHGVRLGFMSFFVKAAVEALKRFPAVNASIDGKDIIYHGYFDIGIAVSTERGLVVPVLRDADQMGMAQIELTIREFAEKARDAKLTMEEMTGGTFTITNGGVFGSMLSTPILNPPQSAILGMHNIVKRAVVENDEVVVRPMMYLAMSYDHRIIDGRESVTFLKTIKELLEDPTRLLLDI